MKYIRTKEGIYDIEKCWIEGKVVKFSNEWFSIIEQADTIEELGDGVLVEDKYNPLIWFDMTMDEFKQMSIEDKIYLVKNWNYYLYIKTSKGLIYVAKMNENGELELL